MLAAPSSSPLGSLPVGPFVSLKATAGRAGSQGAAVGQSCGCIRPSVPAPGTSLVWGSPSRAEVELQSLCGGVPPLEGRESSILPWMREASCGQLPSRRGRSSPQSPGPGGQVQRYENPLLPWSLRDTCPGARWVSCFVCLFLIGQYNFNKEAQLGWESSGDSGDPT